MISEYTHKIKLPTLSKLKGNKSSSPYTVLQQFVINHFGGIDQCPVKNVSDICVHPIDGKVLNKLVYDWAKKKMPGYTEHYLQGAVAMHNLEAGPNDSDEQLTPGYVYLRKTE